VSHKVEFLQQLTDGAYNAALGFEKPSQDAASSHSRRATRANSSGDDFILMGHSIGAYMVLKAANQLANSNVKISKMFLLMPTIRHLYQGLSPFVKVRAELAVLFL
jgi:alpha-beta hydrolase superfamily lysophospholipase